MKKWQHVTKMHPGVSLGAFMSHEEYMVMKLALKKYNNHYGNMLLKRLERSEKQTY